MKKLVLMGLVAASLISFGQVPTKKVDSLLTALDNHPQKDSQQTVILMKLADIYMRNNKKKATEYYNRAIAVSQNGVRSNSFIGKQYLNIGYMYDETKEFDKAIEQYLAAIKLLEKSDDYTWLAMSNIALAGSLDHLRNFDKARSYFSVAEKIFTDHKDSSGLISLCNELGIYYQNKKDYDSAAYIFKKGLSLADGIGDSWSRISMLTNQGLLYKKTNRVSDAISNFEEVITIARKDNLMSDLGDALYNNLACGYSAAKQYSTAIPYFDSSIAYAKRMDNRGGEMENYINMAEMYGNMKDYEKQAHYLQLHYAIKDSLFTQEKNNQVTQMEADYVVGKKSEEVLQQQAEVAKQKNTRNLFISLSLFVLLVAVGLFYFFRRTQRVNRVIQRQKDELQALNDLKNRLFGIISHDLRNPLVTLRSYLSLSDNPTLTAEKQATMKERTKEVVGQTTEMLDNLLIWAGSQIKDNVVQINHTDIEDVLNEAVDTVLPQAQQKNITVNTKVDEGLTALADKNLLSIIFRNILTNAVKYTNWGGRVEIHANKNENNIRVSFADNGIGMSEEQIVQLQQYKSISSTGTSNEKGTGLGLFLVKELLQKLNGTLHIESRERIGSVFTIVLEAN